MNDPIRKNEAISVGQTVRTRPATVQGAVASLFPTATMRFHADEKLESFIKKQQLALPFRPAALCQSLLKDSPIHWYRAVMTPMEDV